MPNLKNIWTVFKKEFFSFFNSPIAYIVLTVFLLVIGWLFFQQFFLIGQSSMRPLFGIIPILFIFFAPAITMRLIAEERKTKTISLLMTLPLTDTEIMIGKFFAAWSLLGIGFLMTIPYAITISSIGTLDWGPVIGGYLGGLLMGAAYLGVGMLFTSLTSNQIIAFILGLGGCFFFFVIDKVVLFLPETMTNFFQYMSVDYHFQNIARGVIDIRDLVFYFSFVAIMLTYSVHLVQREDWR